LITVIARDSGFSAPRRMGSEGWEGGREGQCARRGAGQSIEEGRDAEVARRKAVQPIEEGGEEGEGKCRAHKAPQPKEERDGLRGRGLEWQRLAAAEIRGAHGGLPGRGGDLDVEAALELGAGPSVSRAAGPAPVGLRVAHRDEGTAFAEAGGHAQEHGGGGRGRVGRAVHDRPVAERTGGLPLAAGLVDGDGGVAATGLAAHPDGVELSPVIRQEVQRDEVPLLVVAVVGDPARPRGPVGPTPSSPAARGRRRIAELPTLGRRRRGRGD
jgi:hypothetical protein